MSSTSSSPMALFPSFQPIAVPPWGSPILDPVVVHSGRGIRQIKIWDKQAWLWVKDPLASPGLTHVDRLRHRSACDILPSHHKNKRRDLDTTDFALHSTAKILSELLAGSPDIHQREHMGELTLSKTTDRRNGELGWRSKDRKMSM